MDDNPRLTVHDADARPFLRSTDERYDLIVVDAYHQPYVPFYLATREFFRLVRERLAPGRDRRAERRRGARTTSGSSTAIAGTLAAEFPQVARVAGAPLQHDRARLRRSRSRATELRATARARARRARLAARAARPRRSPGRRPASRPWTDDRAPVEWVTDRMIVAYAAEGGELDEDYLPTRPRP